MSTSSTSTQCVALTQKGSRCKNKCNGLVCHKHKHVDLETISQQPVLQPKVVSKRVTRSQTRAPPSDCCICYDETTDRLDCTHYVCKSCVSHMCTSSCPMCRSVLKGKHITPRILSEIRKKERQATEQRNFEMASQLASAYHPPVQQQQPVSRRPRLSTRATRRNSDNVANRNIESTSRRTRQRVHQTRGSRPGISQLIDGIWQPIYYLSPEDEFLLHILSNEADLMSIIRSL